MVFDPSVAEAEFFSFGEREKIYSYRQMHRGENFYRDFGVHKKSASYVKNEKR